MGALFLCAFFANPEPLPEYLEQSARFTRTNPKLTRTKLKFTRTKPRYPEQNRKDPFNCKLHMIIMKFTLKGCTQMGLFINNEQHHSMYKNSEKINEPNQATFRRDHLAELLQAQYANNDLLHKSIQKLSMVSEQRENRRSIEWQEINSRLSDLEKVNDQQGLQIIEQLKILTAKNERLEKMMKNERVSDQEIVNQIKRHNNELTMHLIKQNENQQELLIKLDNQEALTEKALRQISNLRASLFERTNDLAETIEDSYKLTSSYFYQLLTGADQPLTFYMYNENSKEKKD